MVLGVFLLITFAASIGAIVQKNRVTGGLVALNWVLMADMLSVLVVGTFVWFYTLRERDNFRARYLLLPDAQKIEIQDKVRAFAVLGEAGRLTADRRGQFSCCGYFNSSDLAVVGGAFCTSQEFITNLTAHNFDDKTNITEVGLCVKPITGFADVTLNGIFSCVPRLPFSISHAEVECIRTVYGFMAIVIGLFLASLCVIKKREEEERFKKIDAKRGGSGFV